MRTPPAAGGGAVVVGRLWAQGDWHGCFLYGAVYDGTVGMGVVIACVEHWD